MFVIGKHTDIFQRGVGLFSWGIFQGNTLAWGGKFPGWGFPGEILHCGNLPEFLYEILFICLAFSLPTQFYMWRSSQGIAQEKFSAGL